MDITKTNNYYENQLPQLPLNEMMYVLKKLMKN